MKASGLKVLSEEYSYPISIILTSLILTIEVDIPIIFAFLPLALVIDLNVGYFL